MQAEARSELLAGCLVSLKPPQMLTALCWWALPHTCTAEGAHPPSAIWLHVYFFWIMLLQSSSAHPYWAGVTTKIRTHFFTYRTKRRPWSLGTCHIAGVRNSRNSQARTRKPWYQERRSRPGERTDSAGTCIKFGLEEKKEWKGYGRKSSAFKQKLLKSGTQDLFPIAKDLLCYWNKQLGVADTIVSDILKQGTVLIPSSTGSPHRGGHWGCTRLYVNMLLQPWHCCLKGRAIHKGLLHILGCSQRRFWLSSCGRTWWIEQGSP